ncbi:MAG: NAD(P)H-hydrate dehydratase [Alphaproteobacteria bacterium]|nr:NAD(P)H-hydrate dehydratase [Alphaproteobacteria bacterium]
MTPTAADPHALLTAAEMGRANAAAIAGAPGREGVPGHLLMENAGRAVAFAVAEHYPLSEGRRRIAVLCGPGGGDGFVAARILAADGYDVRVHLLGPREALRGDAASMAGLWHALPLPLDEDAIEGADVVIDALFGAGLSRDLDGVPARLAARARASGVPVVAVDVPSGVDGSTGAVRGTAFAATLTVTFERRKRGHALLPGRSLCGALRVAPIGLPLAALESVSVGALESGPHAFARLWPRPAASGHKYDRGHALVVSGPASRTGAARLAARGALRIGAGLVTVMSPPDALLVNASQLTAIMVRRLEGADGLADTLTDRRLNGVVLGPGCGIGAETRALVAAAARSPAALVLDADALTSFAGEPDALAGLLRARAGASVITPHAGEFARLFGGAAGTDDPVAMAAGAAERLGCTVLLKGGASVIASPGRPAFITTNAPPFLATAGSGDVLAGFICGLMVQGMPAHEAAAAAAWAHGEAARRFGPGLIAEDLPEALPGVIADLWADPA